MRQGLAIDCLPGILASVRRFANHVAFGDCSVSGAAGLSTNIKPRCEQIEARSDHIENKPNESVTLTRCSMNVHCRHSASSRMPSLVGLLRSAVAVQQYSTEGLLAHWKGAQTAPYNTALCRSSDTAWICSERCFNAASSEAMSDQGACDALMLADASFFQGFALGFAGSIRTNGVGFCHPHGEACEKGRAS